MTLRVRRPKKRRVSAKALVYAADGAEKPYPVYEFGRRRPRVERPRHNPFRGL